MVLLPPLMKGLRANWSFLRLVGRRSGIEEGQPQRIKHAQESNEKPNRQEGQHGPGETGRHISPGVTNPTAHYWGQEPQQRPDPWRLLGNRYLTMAVGAV